MIGLHRLQQIIGSAHSSAVAAALDELQQSGWTPVQVATLLSSMAASRESAARPEQFLDIVLSGPEVPGVPTRDTAAVYRTLIADADEELILIGYAVYNGKKLFEPIAARWEERPTMRVRLILNIGRKYKDTSLDSEIVRRFCLEFSRDHWPWERKPDLYYDPRALAPEPKQRTSLHAKCLIVDRKTALVTSANFTEAAQKRNIEAGVIVSHAPFAARMADYFDRLSLERAHLG